MITKNKFLATFVAAIVCVGAWYAFIAPKGTPGTDEDGHEQVRISVRYQPNIPRNEKRGVQVTVQTIPGGTVYDRPEYSSPFMFHLPLAKGQRVTVTASRVVIEGMWCEIYVNRNKVDSDETHGGGRVACTYLRAG